MPGVLIAWRKSASQDAMGRRRDDAPCPALLLAPTFVSCFCCVVLIADHLRPNSRWSKTFVPGGRAGGFFLADPDNKPGASSGSDMVYVNGFACCRPAPVPPCS